MARAKLGRPKGSALLNKDDILKTALQVLEESGSKGLSMRLLAQRLKVTPMALYHHFAGRSALLRELSDMVYGEVFRARERRTGTARERLKHLLLDYHRCVLRHPHLSISIFETPAAFSNEAARITHSLREFLKETQLPIAKQRIWLHILVDFTHGSSIGKAMGRVGKRMDRAFVEAESARFSRELKELLDCLWRG